MGREKYTGLIFSVALALPFGVVACAQMNADSAPSGDNSAAAYASDDGCLRSSQIRSWDVVDRQTLVVEDSRRDAYRVDLVGVCPGIDNAQIALGFESAVSELSCLGGGDDVHYNDVAFGREVCRISRVERLDEVAAANLRD